MQFKLPDFVKEIIKKSKKVRVLTGAGVSRESGVPTFRDKDGLWSKFRPEELANFDAFINNPKLVWEWYNMRREVIRNVKPNPGHYALAEMEKIFPDFWLITQNVDGLHKKAGSKNIIEIHGNIERSYCIDCKTYYNDLPIEKENLPYRCKCGGLIRPDVVWFGELLPENALRKAFEVVNNADLFFSIGTSAVVYPAASFPIEAKRRNAFLIEINIEKTELSHFADLFIQGKSGEILQDMLEEIKQILAYS